MIKAQEIMKGCKKIINVPIRKKIDESVTVILTNAICGDLWENKDRNINEKVFCDCCQSSRKTMLECYEEELKFLKQNEDFWEWSDKRDTVMNTVFRKRISFLQSEIKILGGKNE